MEATNWKKHYHTLGRLLVAKNPEIATALLQTYHLGIIPPEKDYERIPLLYNRFCFSERLDREEFRGPLYKSSKVDRRRLFIAAMLHLFQPQVYHQPSEDILFRQDGFVRKLSETLQQHHGHISRMIREAVFRERVYEDFKENVTSTVMKVMNGKWAA